MKHTPWPPREFSPPSFAMPAAGNRNHGAIPTLFEMVQRLRLTDSDVGRVVAQLGLKRTEHTERIAEKLTLALGRAYYDAVLRPDPFLSHEQGLDGEFFVGHSAGRGLRFGVTREELNGHALLTGQSGSGKSVLLLNLFRQAREL